MNGFLRQSTAAQVRTIGPFIDDTDFKTLKNALTVANTDILLKKNGAASAAKNSGGATADAAGGMYHLTFDATDTGTVGELFYSVKVAGALVVFGSYVVLEEAVYDALFAASAPGYASQASVDDLPTNAELATALAAADDAVLAAIAALNNLSIANVRTAVGLASANLDTQLDALPTNAELATALGTADDAILAAIAALNNLSAAQVSTAISSAALATAANLALAKTEIDAIRAKTDSLTFSVSGTLDANVTHINDTALLGDGAATPWGPF